MPKNRPFRHLAHVTSFQPQPITFFTVVVFKRQNLLNNDTAHTALRGIWERSAERNGWFVGDYLLMPDHVHLFARPNSQADSIKSWVQLWKSLSARLLLKALSVKSPVWQEDYFDRYLRSTESYSQKWGYVRHNPVRAGLVERPEDWAYSGRICTLT